MGNKPKCPKSPHPEIGVDSIIVSIYQELSPEAVEVVSPTEIMKHLRMQLRYHCWAGHGDVNQGREVCKHNEVLG